MPAGIILGVIWALWHAPAFLTSDLTQAKYNFGWFVLVGTLISVLMTWIYVNANRNYLVAGFIPHAANNLMGVSNAFTDTKTQAFVLIAIVGSIVIACGPNLRGWRSAPPDPAKT